MKKKITQGRIEINDIKKQLIHFAEGEYREKRPLELRLIQVKPQTIMQKGSVLPNLLIKALKTTAYAIYLDYGEEIRFYFFDIQGQSLGASTYPKTEKMLKELNGKGTTLLKLPRPDPLKDIDVDSMKLREKIEKTALRIGAEINHTFSAFRAVRLSRIQNLNLKLRYGLIDQEEILVFDEKLMEGEFDEIIILRELYLHALVKSEPADSQIWLATLWALSFQTYTIIERYIQIMKSFQSRNIAVIKGIEWLEKAFLPNLRQNEKKTVQVAKYIFEWGLFIEEVSESGHSEWSDILILWIMKFGLKKSDFYSQIGQSELKSHWILFYIIHFVIEESVLVEKYGIVLQKIWEQPEFAFFHFLSYKMLLTSNIIEDLERLKLFSKRYSNFKFDKNASVNWDEWEDLFQQKQIYQWFVQIPEIWKENFEDSIRLLIIRSLVHNYYKITAPQQLSAKKTLDTRFEIQIENESDWILYDATFKFHWQPESRLMVRIIDESNAKIFDISRKIIAKIMPINSGNALIVGKWEFKDPFHKDKRMTLDVVKIQVTIE